MDNHFYDSPEMVFLELQASAMICQSAGVAGENGEYIDYAEDL